MRAIRITLIVLSGIPFVVAMGSYLVGDWAACTASAVLTVAGLLMARATE